MDRRKALKNMGLAAGFAVATPSILSLLQSCTAPKEVWKPLFFSEEEGTLLQRITEIILPASEGLPGALDVNVPQFIDQYVLEVEDEKGQKLIQSKMAGLVALLKSRFGEDLGDMTDEELESVVAENLKMDKNAAMAMHERVRSYEEAMDKGGMVEADNEALTFSLMQSVRGLSIHAYKISEQVGEQVLAYDPVPGQYLGCAPLQELTGGKAWSL